MSSFDISVDAGVAGRCTVKYDKLLYRYVSAYPCPFSSFFFPLNFSFSFFFFLFFPVYAAPNTPKPDSRMNVSISKSLSTPPDDFEYW